MKTCGDNGEQHPCFHGSTCDMINGVPTCICDDAETAVAGIYCQHKPSEVCKAGAVPSEDGNRGFCVNNGVCVTNKDG